MRVLIVPNADNERALDEARALERHLAARGHEAVLEAGDASAAGLDATAAERGSFGALELVVALGGDGTILRAAHLIGDATSPILGVNLGRLGFLAGADGSDLPGVVERALAGEGTRESRSTLHVDITVGGRPGGAHLALNEVFVGRGPGGRAVDLAVAVNGGRLWRAVCDGVVAATPTGSTAYALSAGGPAMAPDARGLLLVPVSPHALASRPVVLGPHDEVEITWPDAARSGACVVVDGDIVPCRGPLERVVVRTAPHAVTLVRLDGRGFYDVLAETFFGV